ncbi:undecaprenyl-phosphate glucose phosphotransferase [Pontibacter lucknowensis]|uniref:Putative colanic acid biosysnthesis UDP-glucose lipid carrier transferase n=1 Tax=Pontibacter lucknowensis TaxID=1077936 RepID=A0A1N7AU15_9BACT|nr:undecaprenyl-phosphate glucose phosphotransferase [Pontibacter lucknowensis]SIR42478.1 putative colanic acid biosysnthesis UDP-glucose lipid carrier transferase [Pontibacter lucknowensis]
MPGLYSRYIKPIHALGDAVAIAISAASAYWLTEGTLAGFFTRPYVNFLVYGLSAWFICTSLLGTYRFYRVTRILEILANVLKVTLLYLILIEAFLNMLDAEVYSRSFLLYHYLLLAGLVILWRIIVITSLRVYRRKGYNYRRVIIIGYSAPGKELRRFFKNRPEHGYRFLGFFDDKHTQEPGVIGKIDEIEEFVLQNDVDEIYCSPFELQKHQIVRLLNFVDNNLIRLKFLPEPGGLPYQKLQVDFYDMLPVLIFRSIPLDDSINKFLKRTFDIVFSSLVILFILSWLLPILAILIRLDSKGPIFFKQERSGLDNQKFKCWKLRTMYVNNEANSKQAQRGDSRITPIGAILRKTSLDELPQFFNVLMGQMSIVGPRPHMLSHTMYYSTLVDKFMVRHFIKPGITGLSQVRGFRGDTSEIHQMRGRVKLDIFYLENWSFFLDLKIVFYTVYNMLRGEDNAF